MQVKIDKIDTYLGALHVGDYIQFHNLHPSKIKPDSQGWYLVFGIWKDSYGYISLAFNKKGVTDQGNCYSGGGNILNKATLKAIRGPKENNWRKRLKV